jgi:ketosteroid isomerase-like protein
MWDERVSTVRRFTDAVTARDIDAALEFCHPEIEFFSLLAQLEASPYRGFAGIRRYFKDVDAAWDEWRVEVEQLFSAPRSRSPAPATSSTRDRATARPASGTRSGSRRAGTPCR